MINENNLSAVDTHIKHLNIWIESPGGMLISITLLVRAKSSVWAQRSCIAIKTAFNALIRLILEHACPVWNPYLVKHIHSIESIQRRATRLICGSDKPYSERLTELNLQVIIGA